MLNFGHLPNFLLDLTEIHIMHMAAIKLYWLLLVSRSKPFQFKKGVYELIVLCYRRLYHQSWLITHTNANNTPPYKSNQNLKK